MRGAAPTHNVLQNMERFVALGSPTHEYPVQVFFDKFGLGEGDRCRHRCRYVIVEVPLDRTGSML